MEELKERAVEALRMYIGEYYDERYCPDRNDAALKIAKCEMETCAAVLAEIGLVPYEEYRMHRVEVRDTARQDWVECLIDNGVKV